MRKSREDLQSRLREFYFLNGVALPGTVIAIQDFHGVALAWALVRNFVAKGLDLPFAFPRGRSLLERALESASNDFSALGLKATPAMVDGYLCQFALWPWVEPRAEDWAWGVETAERSALAELMEQLPRRSRPGALRPRLAFTDLSPEAYRQWREEVLLIARARILHEDALAARGQYFRLLKAPSLPSRVAFLEYQGERLKDLRNHRDACGAGVIDRLIGSSAAESSRWRLDSLRWQLEVADMELLPLGSYLSRSSVPKQIGIWYALDRRLRALLRDAPSDFSVSRVLAAALMVYAGPRLAPAARLDDFARNAVEKLRRRIPPDLATEIDRRLTFENAIFDFSSDGGGGGTARLVNPGSRECIWEARSSGGGGEGSPTPAQST